MSLLKELPRIAARVLKNTYGSQPWMKERFKLLEDAHGEDAVKTDFEAWCHEQVKVNLNPRYPMSEYLKAVDLRFGTVFADPDDVNLVEANDPKVRLIASASYEQTGYVPPDAAVAKLLRAHKPDEILSAMQEYAATLDDKHMQAGMNKFFTEGAATTVIYTQQQRNKPETGEPKSTPIQSSFDQNKQ